MSSGSILRRLRRAKAGIRIGIVGAGAMGRGLLHESRITPGIDCVAISDISIDKAIAAAKSGRRGYRVVGDLDAMRKSIKEGFVAVCEDGELVARCELVDALIEASNAITAAARMAIAAVEHRKHLVLMNSEIDLLFGPYLLNLARKHGVTYTSCDGDQHGVIKHLIDDITLWGFDLVMAGNIKGFLDRYSDPVKIIPEADIRNLDYRMATSYTDGTKLCIEMALLANGCGLRVTSPGMSGPRAKHVTEVFDLFDFDALWRDRAPVADYILGAEPNGGVFVVGHCDDPYQGRMLSYYKMGPGPFYLFYRPYHLCHVEAMACVAEAVLDGESVLQPDYGLRTNVYAYAKRPLRRGETLDGLGGFTCYGLIDNNDDGSHAGLPICLAHDVTLERDISKDEPIGLEDVRVDPSRFDFDLFFKTAALQTAGR